MEFEIETGKGTFFNNLLCQIVSVNNDTPDVNIIFNKALLSVKNTKVKKWCYIFALICSPKNHLMVNTDFLKTVPNFSEKTILKIDEDNERIYKQLYKKIEIAVLKTQGKDVLESYQSDNFIDYFVQSCVLRRYIEICTNFDIEEKIKANQIRIIYKKDAHTESMLENIHNYARMLIHHYDNQTDVFDKVFKNALDYVMNTSDKIWFDIVHNVAHISSKYLIDTESDSSKIDEDIVIDLNEYDAKQYNFIKQKIILLQNFQRIVFPAVWDIIELNDALDGLVIKSILVRYEEMLKKLFEIRKKM
jgi:hypothetical protein